MHIKRTEQMYFIHMVQVLFFHSIDTDKLQCKKAERQANYGAKENHKLNHAWSDRRQKKGGANLLNRYRKSRFRLRPDLPPYN